MTQLKSNMSFIFLIFLMASCQVTLSYNPAATEKVLGYFANLDVKMKMIDFWKKILVGALDDGPSNSDILNEVKAVSNQISQLGIKLEQKIGEATLMIPARVRADAKVDAGVKDLISRMENIDFLYETYFMKILEKKYDSLLLTDFVNKVLKSDEGPLFQVHKIHRLIHPSRTASLENGLLTDIKNRLKIINLERCDENFSPQYWLFNVYINIMVTEIRAYLMTTLAHSIDEEVNHVSHETVMSSVTEEFLNRVSDHVRVMRDELSTTPRDIRRCDPPNHTRGETFIEFERLSQIFIVNEDEFPSQERCTWCQGIGPQSGQDLITRKDENRYPIRRLCNGTISKCRNVGSSFITAGEVCLLPENNIKRYGWFRDFHDKEKYYGDGSRCDGRAVEIRENIYERWYQHGYVYCKYCMCECASEDPVRSLRSVSIRDQLSAFRSNMVITGVRLVEKNRIIHIQIKEGKLLAGGKIKPESETWVPLEEMDYISRNMVEITHDKLIPRKIVRGTDYLLINEHDNKFVLEDLMAPKGSVVVGVRFRTMVRQEANFKAIALQIMTAPFNWTTGEVGEGQWLNTPLSVHDLVLARSQYDNTHYITNRDVPTKSTVNLPTLEHAVIQFQMSDIHKDFGQSVVPFFDALQVEGNPGLPLGGIGLFWKSALGYGGFISPRIYNVDLSDYMALDNFN